MHYKAVILMSALFMENWEAHRAQSPGFSRNLRRVAKLGKRNERLIDFDDLFEDIKPLRKRAKFSEKVERIEPLFMKGSQEHRDLSPGRKSFLGK
jgi:hypothetical protein